LQSAGFSHQFDPVWLKALGEKRQVAFVGQFPGSSCYCIATWAAFGAAEALKDATKSRELGRQSCRRWFTALVR
jgi:hypothetical protein